jgi:hypothetical protein
MSSVDRVEWADVVGELAEVLERLRAEDAVSLEVGDAFVQFIRFGRGNVVDGPAVFVHTTAGRPGSPAAEGLAALGWARWDDDATVGQPEVPAPVAPATARRLAEVIVRTLRDVHGAADPADVTFSSFNNHGLRAPRLRTIGAQPQQAAEEPDPATLLPEPSPEWQRWCAILADGLGDWSRAALDRLAAAQGWQAAQRHGSAGFSTDAGAWIDAGAWWAGERGHGEISSLSVSQPVEAADAAQAFRRALAGAVSVLGHPPLVGDEGRAPFARWRGERTTLTLAASRGRTLRLLVEPTGPRENVIHNSQKWMMSPDDWSPAELWTTQPDVEAPQARALDGMMFYPHSTSSTIDGTLDELRSLFGSWCEALPLLHPYASSARWRLRRQDGTMVAEGGFTHQRVTARFGWSDGFGEPLAAAPGADTVADLLGRVGNALALAGITTPGQLRGAAWSDTPAERLDAIRLTLRA